MSSTAEASSPCSVSLSEPASSLDSISLTVSTPGQGCSFTVTSADTDATECRRREELETNEVGSRRQGEGEVVEGKVEGGSGSNLLGTNQPGIQDQGNTGTSEVFTCVLAHLEPGTAYHLQVQSKRDEESANITVHTSKS